VLLMIDEQMFDRVVKGLISLSLTSVMALMIGAACSALIPRTAAATTAAYLVLVGLCVVTLLPWLGEGTLFGRTLVETALIFNPLAATLNAVKMQGLHQYELIPRTWIFMVVASIICALVLWIRTRQLTKPQ
jgi:hypothetical protein